MDLFLFERYGLSESERDTAKIEKALEDYKNAQGWDAKIQSKNDKIRNRAKEEKKRWSDDREILLDSRQRESYLDEFKNLISEIIDYISEDEENDSVYADAGAIYNLDEKTVKSVYEKYKNSFAGGAASEEVIKLAFGIRAVENAFNLLSSKLEDNIKDKFQEYGVSMNSLSDALSISRCSSNKDVSDISQKISKLAYDLYNRQIFSSDIKNMFMDIFDLQSTKDESINKLVADPNLSLYFKEYNWVLFRYIKNTCTLMKKSKAVPEQKISEIAVKDRPDFVKAIKQVFGTVVEYSGSVQQDGNNNTKEVPRDVAQGELELKKGNFTTAKGLFSKALSSDPYCWQAYWGMFKASISAKNDTEIYFPGFLQTLRDSDVSEGYPDYVDYYKSAKFNATAQRATEINFIAIEMEYKNADKTQASYMTKVAEIKERYEDNDPNSLNSEKARGISMRANQKVQEYSSWLKLKENGNSKNKWILAGGILLFAVAAVSIWSLFSSDVADYIVIGSIVIGVLLGLFVASESVIIGLIVGVISVIAFAFIATLALDYTFIFAPVCVMLGALLVFIAVKKIKKVRSADAGIMLIEGELKNILNELVICCSEELNILRGYPLCKKYRINIPDIELDFSSYFRCL